MDAGFSGLATPVRSWEGSAYSCSNLEEMDLYDSQIVKSKSLLNFIELKILKGDKQALYDIINLKSLKKLKKFRGEAYDFIHLENELLEEISLSSNQNYSQEIEQIMINKIILMKALKEVRMPIEYLFNDNIQNIKEYNYSVKILTIYSKNHDKNNFEKFNIFKHFVELLRLTIFGINKINIKKEIIIKIEEEQSYSNLEDLYLHLNNFSMNLHIPYEKIKSFTYNEDGKNKVIFKFNKNDYTFKSLKIYKYKSISISKLDSYIPT